jgi:hypothetical protein
MHPYSTSEFFQVLPSPLEVRLTQKNMQVVCMIVAEDESIIYHRINSLSMRGGQREITGHLLGIGYQPVARWSLETQDGSETARQFTLIDQEALTQACQNGSL